MMSVCRGPSKKQPHVVAKRKYVNFAASPNGVGGAGRIRQGRAAAGQNRDGGSRRQK